ncbi:MAG: hypothetical protein CL910_22295 [Deltaproteobacteria bacterium]|jgi:hypothetical protein|nr:hypothetical protein [Deltaproteobacteria bacterium]
MRSFLLLLLVLLPAHALAFAAYPGFTLSNMPRWSATPVQGAGLHDGIQVGIAPGFAASFGLTDPAEIAAFDAALVQSFRVWETPDLHFDIQFDAAPGREIDVFSATSQDPIFQGNVSTGFSFLDQWFITGVTLTSGAVITGPAIVKSSIVVATDRFNILFSLLLGGGLATPADYTNRLINLMAHEIGHSLGLGHPNESTSWDDDGDPLSVYQPADPLNPVAGLVATAQLDSFAMMWGGQRPDFLRTDLRPDDLSGRNALYPTVPEPGLLLLLAAAAAASRKGSLRPQPSQAPMAENPPALS